MLPRNVKPLFRQQSLLGTDLGVIVNLPPKPLARLPRLLVILSLALLYYGTAELSRHIASTPQSVTPVWPPDGVAIAAVLIFGYQVLPGVFGGSILANLWAFFDGTTLLQAIVSIFCLLSIATGTTLGTGVGNYLLRQITRRKNPLNKLGDTYRFLILTGTIAPMINATFGIASLCLLGTIPWSLFFENWLVWWISNVSGICIFTPALISWYCLFRYKNPWYKLKLRQTKRRFNHPPKAFIKWQLLEIISLIFTIVFLSHLCFFQNYNFEYMLIPCIVWSVIRFGQLGATSLIVLVTTIAVLGTVRGLGTFASEDINMSLIELQSFIIVIVVTTLSLTAILAEKKQAFKSLQQSERRLFDKSYQLETSRADLHRVAQILAAQNTALSEAKQSAENANQTKTRFLSNMSHELRTPLNAILGFIQLLQQSPHLDDDEQEDLQIMHESSSHLLHLIDDILDIAKIESGKMELYLKETNLPVFLLAIAEEIKIQAEIKHLDLICEFAPNLPTIVNIDRKRLKQVLLNLLANAIKFTEKGYVRFCVDCEEVTPSDICSDINVSNNSNIHLNSHSNAQINPTTVRLHFLVEDSGIGIAPEKLESIFLPFEQAGTTLFKLQGTGLGLAISQEIIHMMGGEITVESRWCVGSTFEFTLAIAVVSWHGVTSSVGAVCDQKPLLDEPLAQQLPLKILLAEDNLVNQKVATKILARLGYQVDIANNGLEVLACLKQQEYDVILMDMQMPEMDGLEATKRLVQMEKRPYIIALTANAMKNDRRLCLEAGMDDYISKPIKLDILVEALWRSQQKIAQV